MCQGLETDRLALVALATQLQGVPLALQAGQCVALPAELLVPVSGFGVCVVRACAYTRIWFGLRGGRGLLSLGGGSLRSLYGFPSAPHFLQAPTPDPRAWAFLCSPLVPILSTSL